MSSFGRYISTFRDFICFVLILPIIELKGYFTYGAETSETQLKLS